MTVARWRRRPEASDCRTSQVPVDLCVIVGCDKVGETASKKKRRGGELAGQRELMESEGKEEGGGGEGKGRAATKDWFDC